MSKHINYSPVFKVLDKHIMEMSAITLPPVSALAPSAEEININRHIGFILIPRCDLTFF